MAGCLLVGVDVGEAIVPIRVCGCDMAMVDNFRNCGYFAVVACIYLFFLHFNVALNCTELRSMYNAG